jgi:predicted transposase/invertase (TIGR01784 family)
MRSTLDPKLDVIFKSLLARPVNRDLLASLITAVLQPPVPIASVRVLNPELPKDLADDKGALLDVLVRLDDGRQVDVEMQSHSRPGLRQRALFYWARLYASQIGRGQSHTQLEPCVSIFLLDYKELRDTHFHSRFRVLEVNTHEAFSDALELHLVELPKLHWCETGRESALVRWGRFFAAETDEELEELAMQDPMMRKAKEALESLSADPSVQELARQRELGMIGYQLDLEAARKQGKDEGETMGEQRGETRGRAIALRQLLTKRFGDLPRWAEQRIIEATIEQLEAWFDAGITAATLSDVFCDPE